MRRGWAIVAAILVVLVTVGIAVGAYNAGLDEGIRRAADSSQVIEVVGDRYGHGFFFPFGFFLFPLFIFGAIFLVSRAFRGSRGPWGHDHGAGYGPWSEDEHGSRTRRATGTDASTSRPRAARRPRDRPPAEPGRAGERAVAVATARSRRQANDAPNGVAEGMRAG